MSDERVALLEGRVAALERRTVQLLETNVEMQQQLTKLLMARWDPPKPAADPPPALLPTSPAAQTPAAQPGMAPAAAPQDQAPTPPPPGKAATARPAKPEREARERPAIGTALKRITSRTPSRPPDNRGPAALALPKEREKGLPNPVDRRKQPHCAADVASLQAVLEQREGPAQPAKVAGSGLPDLWRPPANVWGPYLATFVGDGSEPPRKIQRLGGYVPAKQCKSHMSGFMMYITLMRMDIDTAAPRTLASMMRGMAHLPDVHLDQVRVSVEAQHRERAHAQSQSQDGDVGPQYSMLTCLHSILTRLVWYSAEAVADTLEVAYRVLAQLKGADTAGQAEMLQASARLTSLNPSDYKVAYDAGCPPYALKEAVQRVQRAARNIHELLQQSL